MASSERETAELLATLALNANAYITDEQIENLRAHARVLEQIADVLAAAPASRRAAILAAAGMLSLTDRQAKPDDDEPDAT